jgi:hypothetical protein
VYHDRHGVSAVHAPHDGARRVGVHHLGRKLLGRAAAGAAAAGRGQVDGEELAEEAGGGVPVEAEIIIVHAYPPVGPKRSVLMLAGG